MKITEEAQILDESVRKKIIEEIHSPENVRRKHEAYKRYKCYKDQTHLFVIDHLLAQFDHETVREMQYAVSNISLVKKIINKLARVYSSGVIREGREESETKAITDLSKILKLDYQMKKANRFTRLQKNILAYVKPVLQKDDKYGLKVLPMQPYFYDVIEDPNDPEKALGIILSHFSPISEQYTELDPAFRNKTRGTRLKPHDNVDQIIADSAEDGSGEAGLNEYIWWTGNYHFTTDQKGKVTSRADGVNPIGMLPFVVLAEDQDNNFWAEGGNDLVDGAIRINVMITNLNHIGVTQGYGQLTMTGKNLPKAIKVGPNHAIQLEYQTGDPVPSVGFINSGAPLSELKELVSTYIALLLSTNNLSTKSVSSELTSGADFASGIAMVIDVAESVEDVEDQAQLFIDQEPPIWKIVARWLGVYGSKGLLIDSLKKIKLSEEVEVNLKFPSPKPIMSEKEKLEVLKMRQDLGIDRMVDMLMKDDPNLTLEEAEQKLKEIVAERIDRANSALGTMMDSEQSTEGEEEGSSEGSGKEEIPSEAEEE
jgi:hypothetical protein